MEQSCTSFAETVARRGRNGYFKFFNVKMEIKDLLTIV